MRKFLLGILLIVLIVALFYKSPFTAMLNYNKAKDLYKTGQYEQSLTYFEKALFAKPTDILSRFYYVLALSKAKPTYTIQKKLYEMSESKINDEAAKAAKAQVMSLRYKLTEGLNNTYIDNAAMGDDIIRWDLKSFPLKVYIEPSDTIPPLYKKTIQSALDLWTAGTNFIKFQEVTNAQDADIVITFKDLPPDTCKGNRCTYTVAYTEPEISNDKILKQMNLTFYKTNPYKKNFTEQEIFNTALHELGHTLGIMGHSDNPEDVMFAMKDNTDYRYLRIGSNSLSMRDLKTLVLLYRIAPTISNTKNPPSGNSYYAPVILGNNDIRLQKKLKENLDYIRNYPHFAAGYINLAGVYTDLGDWENSLKNLDIARQYAANNDEKYIIEYNTAVNYYNKQDYTKALDTAYKAQAIKNDEKIREFISELIKLKTP